MNLLIIGSNFGRMHLEAAIKSKKFKEIFISSPNIMNKNIRFKNKYNNYKKILKTKKINMIVIATPPKIQNDIIEYNQMNGNCEDIEQNLIDQKQKEIIDKINNEEKSENSLLFVISFNSLKNQKLLLEKVYPIESKSEEIT
jgi:hypothetical protein